MLDYLQYISTKINIPLWLLIVTLIWIIFWKLIALWTSARKRQLVWFIVLALVNTFGILEILYIFIFSKFKPHKDKIKIKSRKKRI